MATFDAITFPLTGRRLIEASAGTGKTFNIANLYLRLVLGHGFSALPVEKILVVTFTKAATEELRGRIREKIEMALQAFRKSGNTHNDPFISQMLAFYADDNHPERSRKTACRRLNSALVCMDEASIFTIHGFSVRAIQSFLFETGALAEVELSEGSNARKELAIVDLWRNLQLNKDLTVLNYTRALKLGLQGAKSEKEAFFNLFTQVSTEAAVLPELDIDFTHATIAEICHKLDNTLDKMRGVILSERKILSARWDERFSASTEQAIKDTLKKVLESSSRSQSPAKLLMTINAWKVSDDLSLTITSDSLNRDIDLFMANNTTDVDAQLVKQWITHANSFNEQRYRHNSIRSVLVQLLQAKLSQIDLSSMQLDEVIRLINVRLESGGDAADALRNMITSSYPVCMVDEFQDTDPQQFNMFNKLYGQTPDTGFYMIGDPKQSIYAFRGADIFSYLDVRKQVKQQQDISDAQYIFSLDTNFRSKARLVNVTNALFAETSTADTTDDNKPVFVYSGIHYEPVNSCEVEPFSRNKGKLLMGESQQEATPLVFIGNPNVDGDKINGDTLRWKFARDAAERIGAMLYGKHFYTIEDEKGIKQRLRAGDIAVLVRSGSEARIIRQSLRELPIAIGSVYMSQRDSVFSSAEMSQDIYHILRAMNEPTNIGLLKAAIVTPLYRGYGHDFSDIDNLFNGTADNDYIEKLIEEFSSFKMQWQKYGVLTALHALLTTLNTQRAQRQQDSLFAHCPDSDRLITDFRHLGDLLQQQYLLSGSAEQLIDWYARQLQDDSTVDEDAKRIRLESDENLVKIVTIHVSKGLEYPVVFLPFFYLPYETDLAKNLPLVHREEEQNSYNTIMDFAANPSDITALMDKERMAEDMRLLYVAITRAKYQCYIGITASVKGSGKKPMFGKTVWAHLLQTGLDSPEWAVLQKLLKAHLQHVENDVEYSELFACCDTDFTEHMAEPAQSVTLLQEPVLPELKSSAWTITSYSRLAHAKKAVITLGKDDEIEPASEEMLAVAGQALITDKPWLSNIRFSLRGSADTGQCLHGIYEQISLEPSRYLSGSADAGQAVVALVESQLTQYGLMKQYKGKPEEGVLQVQQVTEWIKQTLQANLSTQFDVPSLQELFLANNVLPELKFDFALGRTGVASIKEAINPALTTAGLAGIHVPFQSELQGFMNGAIDLVFIHDKKVYVLDYKSNTLGKAPRFYGREDMTQCMQNSRYDLQYMIYSVAVHRYFKTRFARQYDYDEGSGLSFGGVFYLFVRGMGIAGQPEDYGIWFHRPEQVHITELDAALNGDKSGGFQ